MSEQGNSDNGSLVPTGRRELASVAAANPLVSRGLVDLAPIHSPKGSATVPAALKDPLFYYHRGNAWLEKNDLAAAAEDFDRAIRLLDEAIRSDPDDALAHLHRGNARLGKVEACEGVEHCDAAIDDFDQADWLDPGNPLVLIGRGTAWYYKEDYDAAITDLDEAIRLDPTNAKAFFARSLVRRSGEGWHDRAIDDLDEAIRLNPTGASWYYVRGNRWLDRGDPDRAIKDFNETIRLRPDDGFAYNRRGRAWRSKGDYDRAIKDFGEAIRLFPENHLFYCDRGLAWLGKKDFDEARQDYDRAFTVRPKDIFAYRWLAWLLATHPEEQMRDGKRAIQLATKACELTGWSSGLELDTLAAAFAEAGQFEEAVSYETRAVEDPACSGPRAEFRERLELYKSRKPYRQNS